MRASRVSVDAVIGRRAADAATEPIVHLVVRATHVNAPEGESNTARLRHAQQRSIHEADGAFAHRGSLQIVAGVVDLLLASSFWTASEHSLRPMQHSLRRDLQPRPLLGHCINIFGDGLSHLGISQLKERARASTQAPKQRKVRSESSPHREGWSTSGDGCRRGSRHGIQ